MEWNTSQSCQYDRSSDSTRVNVIESHYRIVALSLKASRQQGKRCRCTVYYSPLHLPDYRSSHAVYTYLQRYGRQSDDGELRAEHLTLKTSIMAARFLKEKRRMRGAFASRGN
jgi:hypothetical protein